MTLEQWKSTLERKISSNFKVRNKRVSADRTRQKQIQTHRRDSIRMSICFLRMARNPIFAPMVEQAVRLKPHQ